MKRYIRCSEPAVLDSGYADNKEDFARIKDKWAQKDPDAKVKRVRTDTPGLIMYIVEK